MQENNPQSSHRLSRRELRASFLLPVVIAIAIWLLGVAVFVVLPDEFDTAVSLIIAASLIIFLIYWTRHERLALRLNAILLAIPALAGITLGLLYGRSRYTLIGFSITLLLLTLQRFLSTPFSYRMAYSRFLAGDSQQALRLINKSIESRPDFWESYQLRVLLRLLRLDYDQAINDAQQALELQPNAHTVLNTLGQIYLAQMDFEQARDVFQQALALDTDSSTYQYHLGLCCYRLGEYQQAAEALAAATQGTLPIAEYDLWTHYYLGKSLLAVGDEETAAVAFTAMTQFAQALPDLQSQITHQPDYPHMALLHDDLADLEHLLSAKP